MYPTSKGWGVLLARGTNLHGTVPFPGQGLWGMRATTPSSDRAEWSPAQRVLDTDMPGTPPWMGRGVCGPSVVPLPDGRRRVFLTGTREAGSWWQAARVRATRAHRLPAPSPYFLPTGAIHLTT